MADEATRIARAAAGDRQALEHLLREVQDDVYRFLYRLSGSNAGLVDDLLQETFIGACAGIGTFRGESSFRTWILGIARNVLRQSRRRSNLELDRRRALSGMRQLDEVAGTEELLPSQLSSRVQWAFYSLASGQREALYLHEILGCTYAETATILGISKDAAKNRIYNGRMRLKQALSDAR